MPRKIEPPEPSAPKSRTARRVAAAPGAAAEPATKAGSKTGPKRTARSTGKAGAPVAEAATPAPAPKPPRRGKTPLPPAPPPRRNKAVANAAAAAHGKTLTAWTEDEIVEAFSRFEAQDPEPKGELEHTDAFTLLVAVVLSAQATDVGVNKATRGLFAAAATPAAMVALGEEEVARHIRTLGLYRNKAKNVVELSRLLLERHKGIVPQDREALEALPGVGRKTANVVLNIAFGSPTIAVDTHLFRVANRTGLAPGATPLAVELGLEARIPNHFKLHAHHWLILHGRYICKAVKPACGRCIIADLCRWPDKQF
ncbi:endonuclease III [Xanthobacter dioxanivorans]|uniref:Endonuclease III n=1 Tax=Xanthobacter dioxanivorans TaxID=2528964 RepID=A0A974PND6_9HYPH|nr:endonuclease III [Xanthobacter dioxanivorans]